MLPPLIVEGGDILVSGENEAQALLRAARSLGASPVLSIRTRQPPLGPCPMSYRNLTGSALFRAAQTIDKRVLASTVLGAAGCSPASAAGARALVLPMPEGISPMDWPQWAALRNMGYEWTLRELEAQAGFE